MKNSSVHTIGTAVALGLFVMLRDFRALEWLRWVHTVAVIAAGIWVGWKSPRRPYVGALICTAALFVFSYFGVSRYMQAQHATYMLPALLAGNLPNLLVATFCGSLLRERASEHSVDPARSSFRMGSDAAALTFYIVCGIALLGVFGLKLLGGMLASAPS